MGRKHIVPYGLYRAHIFVNAKLAERTGFGQEDLDHVFDALKSMFEHDRSAARGEMASRRVIAFKHSSALGNAPAHELFDRVIVQRKYRDDLYALNDDKLDNAPPARRYQDYEISVPRDGLTGGHRDRQRVVTHDIGGGPRLKPAAHARAVRAGASCLKS